LGQDVGHYIPWKRDWNHRMDDRRSEIVRPFGPVWASLLNVFLFLFSFLLHHCNVTHKNNCLIYIIIFFVYNILQISCSLEVPK
jgi:hypothetical protein